MLPRLCVTPCPRISRLRCQNEPNWLWTANASKLFNRLCVHHLKGFPQGVRIDLVDVSAGRPQVQDSALSQMSQTSYHMVTTVIFQSLRKLGNCHLWKVAAFRFASPHMSDLRDLETRSFSFTIIYCLFHPFSIQLNLL